ncbi:MAG TPA: hypothetical protein VEU08_08125 [Vicinamibacterales bacterium]|nr:hypothetical protein [Vicinamibacterales bacterium]
MTRSIIAASVLVLSALAVPVFAQSKTNGNGNGKGNGHASNPPSKNVLAEPPVEIASGGTGGASPFAWVDDATVLEPGAGSVGFAAAHFSGADLSENDFPIVEAALGVASRVQLSISVPHVVGDAAAAVPSGVGTTFVAAKVGLIDDPARHFKVAITPTLEILGASVTDSLTGESRTQFGLPASAEIDRGPMRLYGAGGFFTSGVRFAGGGAAYQASPRAVVSLGFSHSWRPDDADTGVLGAVRSEISGGFGYVLLPRMVVFGSVGRTIATLDENGAGTTVSGGVSFSFATPTTELRKKP